MKLKHLLLLMLLTQYCCFAQNGNVNTLNTKQARTVDSLTSHWNRKNMPGGAIAIIHNNKVIYQNALGYSNIASKKKNTINTSFLLAQISDNFVAYALLKLAKKGTVNLNDKLNTYLPYTSHFEQNITLRNLLEKSSGLHDFEVLKNIAGWSDNSSFSGADVIKLISKQKDLSFKPGTEFSDSRSNMVLISQVIEKASKISFEDYMRQHIFEPLQMKNTFVLNKTNQSRSNLAKSYSIAENGETTFLSSKKETYASINIASSIYDMALWELHLSSPSDRTKPIVEMFNNYVKLSNGKEYNIPRGKLKYGQKYVHKERGLETDMVTGGIDGYASAIFNFPDANFTVITLSNNGEGYNGYIGMLSAHSIIEDSFLEPTSIDFKKINTIKLNANHKKYEGKYWDGLGEISREIRIENDTLRYVRNSYSSALIPLSNNRFQMKTDFDDKIYLTFNEQNGKISMKYAYAEATPFDFIKYSEKKYSEKMLNTTYSGNYYCEPLGIGYNFMAKEGQLVASNIKTDDITFTPIMNTLFSGDKWYLGSIEFQKNNNDKITGFYVRNDAIRNLWFKKIN